MKKKQKTNKIVLTKEQAMSKIIDDDILKIKTDAIFNDFSYINYIFSDGFKGYYNFTKKELEIELTERNILEKNTFVIK